jgi:hypothetical protein
MKNASRFKLPQKEKTLIRIKSCSTFHSNDKRYRSKTSSCTGHGLGFW